jgi:hypothetical protein
MPTTRVKCRFESEGDPPAVAATTRQRNTARARSRVNRGGGPAGGRTLRRSMFTPNLDEGDREDVFFDDEEEDVYKALHAKDGKDI